MHVHIAAVGFSREPVLKVVRRVSGIDELYLLHTDSKESYETAIAVRGDLGCIIPEIRLVTIPFSDFMGIVSAVYRIYEDTRGKDVEYSVNITGGTNLMAAALCYSSYYIRAKIFYSLNSDEPISRQVIEINAPKAVDISSYRALTRDILRFILECNDRGEHVTNSIVADRFGINKQKAGYHIKILYEDGLLRKDAYVRDNRTTDNRMNELVLTPQGVMIARNLRVGPCGPSAP